VPSEIYAMQVHMRQPRMAMAVGESKGWPLRLNAAALLQQGADEFRLEGGNSLHDGIYCTGGPTPRAHPAHPVYPYLLRGLSIEWSNQVWTLDITYIPMARGFVYLVAVMDWHSRKVLRGSAPRRHESLLARRPARCKLTARSF
jgi:transposase InsO family protein